MPAIPPPDRDVVVHDPTIDRYLAPAGEWTPLLDDALRLSRAEATAWVTRAACEPYRLAVVPAGLGDQRRIA